MTQYILAIDNGTQSVRALLFDLQGKLVDKSQVAITYQSAEPGWAEADADVFWQALCQACQQLWQTTRVNKSDIAGLVITTQRGTTLALDAKGQPLRPAMIWLDQRRTEHAPRLAWWWETAFRAIGMRDTVRHFQKEAEANWIAQHQPDLWARTAKYLLLSRDTSITALLGALSTRSPRRWATCRSTTKRASGRRRTIGNGRPCPSPPPCCPSW